MPTKKKNKGGRPPIIKTPEEMERKVNKYFSRIEKSEEPPTVSGLCLALEFGSRRALLDYSNKDLRYHNIIKKAKLRIEKSLEKKLLTSRQVAGIIFNLKNNFKWIDKQEIEKKGKVKLVMDTKRGSPKKNKKK